LTDVKYKPEVEDDLSNEDGHFRSVHRECFNEKPTAKGSLVIANCGSLYRTLGFFSGDCPENVCSLCLQAMHDGKVECFVCGRPMLIG